MEQHPHLLSESTVGLQPPQMASTPIAGNSVSVIATAPPAPTNLFSNSSSAVVPLLPHQQSGDQSAVQSIIELEQCCVCSGYYEQERRQIPQPDLNKMICKLLDVIPNETSFFRDYMPICTSCSLLLRKFDKLRVELEFIKTQVVTCVVESLTQILPHGGSHLDALRTQILQRWTSSGNQSTRQQGYSAVARSGNGQHSGDLSWAAHNNLLRNETITEDQTNWTAEAESTAPQNDTTKGAEFIIPDEVDEVSSNRGGDVDVVEELLREDSVNAEVAGPSTVNKNNNNTDEEAPGTTETKKTRKRKRKLATRRKTKEVIPLICTICGRIYDRRTSYNAHAQACKSDDLKLEKNCTICSEQTKTPCLFQTWEEFKNHVYSIHSTIDIEQCSYCTLRFLPNGKRTHKCRSFRGQFTTEPIFQCDRCDRKYHSRPNLTDHVRRVHKDQKHTCSMCGKTYGSPLLLALHVARHKRVVSKFQCTKCGVCLSSKYGLAQHMKIHAGQSARAYVCMECGKKFLSKGIYRTHQMVHTTEKPHACPLCGVKFKLKATMRRHFFRHGVNETNYTKKCPLCPTSQFRKIWILKKHMELEHPGTREAKEILEKYKDVNDMPLGRDIKYDTRPGRGRKLTSSFKMEVVEESCDDEETDVDDEESEEADDNGNEEGEQSTSRNTSESLQPSRQSARLLSKTTPNSRFITKV